MTDAQTDLRIDRRDVDQLPRVGACGRAEIDRLQAAADMGVADNAMLQRLVDVRHRSFVPVPRATEPWPRPAITGSAAPGVPEIHASQLDASALAEAFDEQGCLLVRELAPRSVADEILADTLRAFEAERAFAAGAPVEETAPWYVPFEATDEHPFGEFERYVVHELGGVLTVESPVVLARLMAAFNAARVGEVIAEYFGEWPALSVKKTTLRRVDTDSPTYWHQDGAFLGADTRSVNVWMALTDCGVDAPSIDIVPRAFDHVVETGGDGAMFAWSVGEAQAGEAAGIAPVRPSFAPGDVLLFNQLTLHSTAIDPAMTRARYASESWFFAPSTYPIEQVPFTF